MQQAYTVYYSCLFIVLVIVIQIPCVYRGRINILASCTPLLQQLKLWNRSSDSHCRVLQQKSGPGGTRQHLLHLSEATSATKQICLVPFFPRLFGRLYANPARNAKPGEKRRLVQSIAVLQSSSVA